MSAEDNPADKPASNAIQKAVPQPTPGAQPLPFQPEFFHQFLKNQADEIAIRSQELGLRQKEIETSHEYANHALDAQAEDRKDERNHKKGARRDRFILVGISVVILAGLVVYAMWLNKDALAMEAIKDLVLIGAGGIGGYGARTIKEAEKKTDTTDE